MIIPRHDEWAIAEISDGRCCAILLESGLQAVAGTVTLRGSGAVENVKIAPGGALLFELPGGTWIRTHLVRVLRRL